MEPRHVACGRVSVYFSAGGPWSVIAFCDHPVVFAGVEPDFEIQAGSAARVNRMLLCVTSDVRDESVCVVEEYAITISSPDAEHRAHVWHTLRILGEGRELRRTLRARLLPAAYPVEADVHPAHTDTLPYATHDAPDRVPVQSATLRLHGWTVREARGAVLSVPMARIPAGLAWDRVGLRPRHGSPSPGEEIGADIVLTAPDAMLGAVVIQRPTPPLCLVVVPLPPRCAARTRVYGGNRPVIEHQFDCETWLRASTEIELASQLLCFAEGDWRSVLPPLARRYSCEGYRPPLDRPMWAKDAVIQEVEPGFHGGVPQLLNHLDQFQSTGFDTIYLMPWHVGGYATRHYERIHPALGSLDDLRRFGDDAHRRGLRVLFDLLVNIVAEDSPYAAEHPEWFYRDESGRPLRHPIWGGRCLDPASPGFRAFLIDYAVRCCREWGADGFRVDAATHRGGLWTSPQGLPPHEHSYAVFTLLADLRAAIRRHHPEAILFAECFGPQQVPVSDCVGFQWVLWLDWISRRLLARRVSGSELQRILGEHFLAMPPGTWLVGYTHTHDTLAFTQHDPHGAPVDMLFAWLTLTTASVMVFAGGWGMPQRPFPEQREAYRALFQQKKRLGGVSTDELSFPPVEDPALLVAERPSRQGRVRVVANVSDDVRPCPFRRRRYSWKGSPPAGLLPWDVIVQESSE